MREQERKPIRREVEKVDIQEIEHRTEHPGPTEFSMLEDEDTIVRQNSFLNNNSTANEGE